MPPPESWSHVRMSLLISWTADYIVYLDEDSAVDWETTSEWDKKNPKDQKRFMRVLNRGALLEVTERDNFDREKTVGLRRLIGEAYDRALAGDYDAADHMIEHANSVAVEWHRGRTITDYVKIKAEWGQYFRVWTAAHYVIGIGAIVCSTFVAAAKPDWFGSYGALVLSVTAWLVALLTALLTFLTPDRKARAYRRAWSILNSEITRFNADKAHTLNGIIDAHERGENILSEATDKQPTPTTRRRPPGT